MAQALYPGVCVCVCVWPQLASVAHYGELNGDPMRDPEIVFEVVAGSFLGPQPETPGLRGCRGGAISVLRRTGRTVFSSRKTPRGCSEEVKRLE
jgi:hypothetical protein